MVPTKVSCGRSGSFDLGTATTFGAIVGVTAGAGGRREGEKIGRSRVTANCESGMAHNGLALGVSSDAGAGGAEGGAATCTEGGSGPPAAYPDFTPLTWSSSASPEIAEIDDDAPP